MSNIRLQHVLFFAVFLVRGILPAQVSKAKTDSLYTLYTKETVDTSKVNILIALAKSYKDQPVKSVSFSREALELSERIGYEKGICYSASMIGAYFSDQLNYPEAIKIYLKALNAGEKAKLTIELSKIYNSIGIMYSNQDRNDEALKYFLKVAKLSEDNHLEDRLAVAYNNIGITYKDMKRYQEAKKFYEKALQKFEKTDFKKGIASASNNLGIVSHALKNDEEALAYYNKAIERFHSVGDTLSESGIYINIGELYNDNKEYKRALDFYLDGLEKAKKFKHVSFTNDAYDGLSKVYANMKQYDKAYFYMEKHLRLKDSINSEEGMRQVQEMEKRLENEKQEREIQLLKQSKEIQDLKVRSQSEKLKQNSIVIYSVLAILIVVLIMSFLIFKAYKQIKRTNLELAETKKEIQDSINYAKNIQEAMLPDVTILKKHFPEVFGLFLPKDVVSGDFYWFGEFRDKIYFAVADCTGHGVPGGFMSMIGIDKLNQSINDKKIEDLSGILSFLNISIKKALKQETESSLSKDGMDIAICSFDKKSLVLKYAGANRPLWLIRDKDVIEYKATKASIAGFTENDQLFEEVEIKLEKEDVVYLFSDGYADQFGGPNKKKFMTKQLKQVLIDNHQLPMSQQENRFHELFNAWRGNIGQVDDVLLLGIRI